MIAKTRATAVHNHDRFVAGQAPTTLTPTVTKSFVANDESTKACIMAAKSCSKTHLMWRVKIKDGKILPAQVVLMTRVKIVVQGNGDVVPL